MIYTMYINFKEDVQGRALRLYPSRSQVYPATQTWRQLFGPTVTQKCWWKRRTPSTPTIIILVPWLSHIPFRAKFLLPSKPFINCLDWQLCKSVDCWWKRRTPSSPTIIILIPWLSHISLQSQVYLAMQTWRPLFGLAVTRRCWWRRRTPAMPDVAAKESAPASTSTWRQTAEFR